MVIKLLIISLLSLPNGLYKKTVEEVRGYKTIDQCLIDKGRVIQALGNSKGILKLEVNCIEVGKI